MSSTKDHLYEFDRVRPDWNEDRQASVFAGIEKKKRKRMAVRGLVSGGVVAAGLILVLLANQTDNSGPSPANGLGGESRRSPAASIPKDDANPPIAFKDGSKATPLDDDSRLVVETMTDTLIAVRILEGGGRFEVSPQDERAFEVRLNELTVTVVGTEFEVNASGEKALVSVVEGQVRVDWPGGQDELRAGQHKHYPTRAATSHRNRQNSNTPSSQRSGPAENNKRTADWRTLAEKGDFDGASSLLLKETDVRDTVEDLLLAADAMRFSKKPAKAMPYLDRIIADHAADPRASLSEFTRGRILLNQLGRPKDAATAFANVRRLAPQGSLAQDALAREVEAHHRAGNAAQARKKAREYESTYPDGRRLDAVRRFGDLAP